MPYIVKYAKYMDLLTLTHLSVWEERVGFGRVGFQQMCTLQRRLDCVGMQERDLSGVALVAPESALGGWKGIISLLCECQGE